MYVCPVCKAALSGSQCTKCKFRISGDDQIPMFFSGSPLSNRYKEIGQFYDSVYEARQNAWKDHAGRGEEFVNYVAGLIDGFAPRRHLDVGCGQGYILSAASVPEKYGLDLSRKAMDAGKQRSSASFCQGIVEELPYPDSYFDVVTGIGVLEHLLDCSTGMQEIARILRKGGLFITLIYVSTPLVERVKIKIEQFVHPRFQPIGFVKWMMARYSGPGGIGNDEAIRHTPIVQPVQNQFTVSSLRRLFVRNGFRIKSLITKRLVPDAPLEGHHFRIYVLERVG